MERGRLCSVSIVFLSTNVTTLAGMGPVLGAGSDKAHYGQKFAGSSLAGLNLMFHPVGPDYSRSVGLNFVFLLAAQARRRGADSPSLDLAMPGLCSGGHHQVTAAVRRFKQA